MPMLMVRIPVLVLRRVVFPRLRRSLHRGGRSGRLRLGRRGRRGSGSRGTSRSGRTPVVPVAVRRIEVLVLEGVVGPGCGTHLGRRCGRDRLRGPIAPEHGERRHRHADDPQHGPQGSARELLAHESVLSGAAVLVLSPASAGAKVIATGRVFHAERIRSRRSRNNPSPAPTRIRSRLRHALTAT